MLPLARVAAPLIGTGAIVIACSSPNPGETSCVALAPPSCPDAGAPSYDASVASIVSQYCVPCHKPGGSGAQFDFGSYGGAKGLYANRLSALGQVNGCLMPNRGAPPLPTDDKVTLLTWLVCGAPDN